MFTSAIRKARGSVVPMNSTSDHARPWDLKPQQRDLTLVLRRPVEPATKSGRGRVSDPTIRLDGWSQCMDQLSVCRRQRCRHASPHPGNGGAIADELIE